MKILDLGCGKQKNPDSIGLDMNPGVNPDIVYEVRFGKNLPFQENSFEKVYMRDFIEHVDNIAWLLSEVHRVSLPGAYVEVQYPHYSSPDARNDVTHRHYLGAHILDHFDPSSAFGGLDSQYTLFGRNFPFRLSRVDVNFQNGIAGKISRFLLTKYGIDFYERHFSAFFPIKNIQANLSVIK